jgi:hypothetical protein
VCDELFFRRGMGSIRCQLAVHLSFRVILRSRRRRCPTSSPFLLGKGAGGLGRQKLSPYSRVNREPKPSVARACLAALAREPAFAMELFARSWGRSHIGCDGGAPPALTRWAESGHYLSARSSAHVTFLLSVQQFRGISVVPFRVTAVTADRRAKTGGDRFSLCRAPPRIRRNDRAIDVPRLV